MVFIKVTTCCMHLSLIEQEHHKFDNQRIFVIFRIFVSIFFSREPRLDVRLQKKVWGI